MNYANLFASSDNLSGGLFSLTVYRSGERKFSIAGDGDFSMIFCLDGSVEFRFRYQADRSGEEIPIRRE